MNIEAIVMCDGDKGRFRGKAFCTVIPKTSVGNFTCTIVLYASFYRTLSSINSKTSGFRAIKALCLGVSSYGLTTLLVLEMADKHRCPEVMPRSLFLDVKPNLL